MVWSNKYKFAMMLAAKPDKHLLNLYDAFKDLLLSSSFA
jgi:hypothetical protein